MAFILHPLSHYNTITKPRAWFLLSILEDISIDFLSHFILSLIDVYRDTVTRDKLIFPSAITRIIHHFFVPCPMSDHFPLWVSLTLLPLDRVRLSFARDRHRPRRQLFQLLPLLPPPLLCLLWVEWLLRPSWHSLCAWILTLTLSVMSCIRWTPVLVVSHDDRLSWVV